MSEKGERRALGDTASGTARQGWVSLWWKHVSGSYIHEDVVGLKTRGAEVGTWRRQL